MRTTLGFTCALVAAGLAWTPLSAQAADAAPARDASKLFVKKCSPCHGKTGKGDAPLGKKFGVPDFTNADWQEKHDLAAIKKIIGEGVPNTRMKPFRSKLKPEEIDALAKLIKGFGKK